MNLLAKQIWKINLVWDVKTKFIKNRERTLKDISRIFFNIDTKNCLKSRLDMENNKIYYELIASLDWEQLGIEANSGSVY